MTGAQDVGLLYARGRCVRHVDRQRAVWRTNRAVRAGTGEGEQVGSSIGISLEEELRPGLRGANEFLRVAVAVSSLLHRLRALTARQILAWGKDRRNGRRGTRERAHCPALAHVTAVPPSSYCERQHRARLALPCQPSWSGPLLFLRLAEELMKSWMYGTRHPAVAAHSGAACRQY